MVLAVTPINCTSEDIPFIVLFEVRNSDGVTEKIGWQSGVLDPNGRTDVGVLWTPKHGDNYEVRSFAITDFEMPNILTPVSASNQEIVERNTEMLELEFYVTQTQLSTQETYGTSYYLVNNGRRPVALTVDDYIGSYESSNGAATRRLGPDSLCTWKNAFEIEQPDIILEPKARMNLTDMSSFAEAPKYPGIYSSSPFVILSVQGQNRVKCMEIVANEVILNVTGAVRTV